LRADIKTWNPDGSFEVILDMGCLHRLPLRDRDAHRRQLCRWLAPGGDFILIHCGSRGCWDRWPVGPHRIGRAAVVDLFSPEMTLHEYGEERLRLRLSIGYSALASRYWFKREPVSTNP